MNLYHPITLEPIEDNAENRLNQTLFIVEATEFEQHVLWSDHSSRSKFRRFPHFPTLNWEEISPGWIVTVGHSHRRPICISVSWARIEGHLIMFYHGCSQLVDSIKIAKWLDKNFKGKWDRGTCRAACDVNNFHHCLQAIREANGPIR